MLEQRCGHEKSTQGLMGLESAGELGATVFQEIEDEFEAIGSAVVGIGNFFLIVLGAVVAE